LVFRIHDSEADDFLVHRDISGKISSFNVNLLTNKQTEKDKQMQT